MRNFGKIATALALASVAAGPAVANPAERLSIGKSVRAPTVAKKSSSASAPIVPIVILVGILAGAVLLVVDEENSDSP